MRERSNRGQLTESHQTFTRLFGGGGSSSSAQQTPPVLSNGGSSPTRRRHRANTNNNKGEVRRSTVEPPLSPESLSRLATEMARAPPQDG